jgi:hypothetical protein
MLKYIGNVARAPDEDKFRCSKHTGHLSCWTCLGLRCMCILGCRHAFMSADSQSLIRSSCLASDTGRQRCCCVRSWPSKRIHVELAPG